MAAGQTLYLKNRHSFELDTSGMPESQVEVYDPDDRRHLNQSRTITGTDPAACYRLTVPYSRIEITAAKAPGMSSASGQVLQMNPYLPLRLRRQSQGARTTSKQRATLLSLDEYRTFLVGEELGDVHGPVSVYD